MAAAGPRPKYRRVRDALTVLVTRELQPGDAIPSERELMSAHDVSRETVRKAVDALVVEGRLERVHGKGTFVTRPRMESHLHLASFSQDMRRRGLTPSSHLLAVEADVPPADVAGTLGLPAEGRAWRIERVRLANGRPVAVEHGWYPHHLLPALDAQDLSGSLYELLADTYGLVVDRAEQTLWSEAADRALARRLETGANAPLLAFRRTAYAAGQPVESVVSRYRGDRYQLHMSLGSE
jgi:GntR family transcriptional regulator